MAELNKAVPLYEKPVELTISYEIPDSWEVWSIEVEQPPVGEPITSDWLQDNPEKWSFVDFIDRGGDQIANLRIEPDYVHP